MPGAESGMRISQSGNEFQSWIIGPKLFCPKWFALVPFVEAFQSNWMSVNKKCVFFSAILPPADTALDEAIQSKVCLRRILSTRRFVLFSEMDSSSGFTVKDAFTEPSKSHLEKFVSFAHQICWLQNLSTSRCLLFWKSWIFEMAECHMTSSTGVYSNSNSPPKKNELRQTSLGRLATAFETRVFN